MNGERWRYAVQILRADDSPVRQVPITIDADPLRECLRFVALRQGSPSASALALECVIEPIWNQDLGEPYLGGLRACSRNTQDVPATTADFSTKPFNSAARAVVSELVEEGSLEAGEEVRFLPMAYAQQTEPDAPVHNGRFKTQAGAPSLHIRSASLAECLARSVPATSARAGVAEGTPLGAHTEVAEDIAVFLPQAVLDEARELARAEQVRETGGLLIGHVCRDEAGGDLYVEVTAQLPARHVEATLHRLTFTSDTWTDFRSALELRRRAEIMIGWWHSHPVREWCKKCPEQSQRACTLRGDFLSEDDRLLQRTVFPRAYSLALVANVVAYEAPTFSLFGWRQGQIELRTYRVLPAPVGGAVVSV